jgi:DNA-directed RNA polymerase I, II, and III subunit RPABC2
MAFQQSFVISDDVQKVNGADTSAYITLPWLTKYEFDQVIGLRTMHLSKGAIPLVDVPEGFKVTSNTQLRQIALEELRTKKLPYIVKRPLPNGKSEYWPVSKLELHAIQHMMR